jgi:uncharacterized membrane protein YpjA
MLRWGRVLLLGFLSWLIPFVVSFVVFPLKKTNSPLFSTLMTLVVILTAGILFPICFRGRRALVFETVLVGLLWVGINLVLDYPMFAYGPMKMTAAKYYSEIGLSYLIYPAFGFGAAWLVRSQEQGRTLA